MKTDILIIGGGLAGLTAGYNILKKKPDMELMILQPGAGASPHVHGISMPFHSNDSIALFKEDTANSGLGQGDPVLVNVLCEGSLKLIPFFDEIGIRLNRNTDGSYQLLQPLGASVPRVASVGNCLGGAVLAKLRHFILSHRNARIINNMRAMELITNGSLTVNGAICYNLEDKTWTNLYSASVILAAGGFSNIYPISTNSADISGDAICMAYEAGAEITDMEFVQFEPSCAVWPEELIGKPLITTMFYEGAVLRNKNGKRFMLDISEKAEQVNKDLQATAIYDQIRYGYGTEHRGIFFDATGVGKARLCEAYPVYVKRYENVGIDLSKVPVEVAPAPHTSLGGVYPYPDCSTNVKGLFVCGETLGGLHGANRMGGNAGLETMVFGSIAGSSASAYAEDKILSDKAEETRKNETASSQDIQKLRRKLERNLRDRLNVIRNEEGLDQATVEIKEILEILGSEKSYEARRLYHDSLTALIAICSAKTRKESIGCHVRDDSGTEDKKYRVVVKKGESSMEIRKTDITRV